MPITYAQSNYYKVRQKPHFKIFLIQKRFHPHRLPNSLLCNAYIYLHNKINAYEIIQYIHIGNTHKYTDKSVCARIIKLHMVVDAFHARQFDSDSPNDYNIILYLCTNNERTHSVPHARPPPSYIFVYRIRMFYLHFFFQWQIKSERIW